MIFLGVFVIRIKINLVKKIIMRNKIKINYFKWLLVIYSGIVCDVNCVGLDDIDIK